MEDIFDAMDKQLFFTGEFEKYITATEPDIKERSDAWRVAIGLQKVDNLEVSQYLIETAKRNIEGEITIDEAEKLIKSYYTDLRGRKVVVDRNQEEADKVAVNITRLIGEPAFTFSAQGLANIHRRIFNGVFPHAGKFRKINIYKKEPILEGDTVLYSDCSNLSATIAYDLEQERNFNYSVCSQDEILEHIARFVANLWQIHPFEEGNTRTTAIFTIKYLRSIGFPGVDNTLFEEKSWYFRNALVRANYRNVEKNIEPNYTFLILFFKNLLYGENNELRNRYTYINWDKYKSRLTISSTPASTPSSTPASTPSSTPSSTPASSLVNPLNTRQTKVVYDIPESELVLNVIKALGHEQMTLKQLMEAVGLKDRMNFMKYSLSPVLEIGYVKLLYPDSPRHPRQKYLLTIRGKALYNSLQK